MITKTTLPTAAESITLHDVSLELVPGKNWQERAKEGRASMFFSASGDAVVAGQTLHVTVNLPAVDADGDLTLLGIEKPNKDGIVYRVKASDAQSGFAKIKCKVEGGKLVPELDADGQPVFLPGQEIATPDGTPFDLRYGVKSLVNTDGSKTLRLTGVSLADDAAATREGFACVKVTHYESCEVVDKPARVAAGAKAPAFGRFGAQAQAPRAQGGAEAAKTQAAAGTRQVTA